MNWIAATIISFLAAAVASMGIGGGAVLLLFLAVFGDTPLQTAQGMNLLIFLPVGLIALFFHKKSGLLELKKGIALGLWGIPGVLLGVWLSNHLDTGFISKCFAVFLFYLGLKSLFSKRKDEKSAPTQKKN